MKSKGDFCIYILVITPMGLNNTSMPVTGTDQSIPSPFAPGYVLLAKSQIDVTLSNISANIAKGH